jgi:hypothetical protein
VGGSSVRRVGVGQDARGARRETEGTDPTHQRSELSQSACVAAPAEPQQRLAVTCDEMDRCVPEILERLRNSTAMRAGLHGPRHP